MSFIIFTRHAEYDAILCRRCATSQGLKELAKSALLGWWGIPWGLLTLKAIWINIRSLARWSTLPAGAPPLLAAAALAVPLAVGCFVWDRTREAESGKATGDYVSEAVASWVERGHERFNAGDSEGALEFYLRAHEAAPDSGVINYLLASTYFNLGAAPTAFAYARRAEEIDPNDASKIALHGVLELGLGKREEAEACAGRLVGKTLADYDDVGWTVELLYNLEDWQELLRVSELGMGSFPDALHFRFMQLSSLLALDRIEDFRAAHEVLAEEERQDESIRLAQKVFLMRTEPLSQIGSLTAGWVEGYPPTVMQQLATAAERSRQLPPVRAAVREWLHDPKTPGDAWATASPWFAQQRWPQELDDYLAVRTETSPGLLRLQTMDPVRERDRLLALADRLRNLEHPLTPWIDVIYFTHATGKLPRARRSSEFVEHVTEHPDHIPCRLALAHHLLEDEPAAARVLIEELKSSLSEDPAFAHAVRLVDTMLLIVEERLDEAATTISAIPPGIVLPFVVPAIVDLEAAEIAFHRGDEKTLHERLEQTLATDDPGAVAAGLVLRWSAQLAAGRELGYRSDVDRLLERPGEELEAGLSPSLQSILLAEERVDVAWVSRVTG
ncbi:MAG: hypothetical protein GY856_00690, partial [bacterium]|nr:hypothetical protein [bacterium]